ncbi:MAG: PqqD family protein [Candidatus Altiarchaeota archaeon]
MEKIGTYVVRNDNVESTVLDDECMLFHPEKNLFYKVNDTGTFIWEAISRKISIDTIIQKLTSNFDVDKKIAKKEVISFLKYLKEKDLIEYC